MFMLKWQITHKKSKKSMSNFPSRDKWHSLQNICHSFLMLHCRRMPWKDKYLSLKHFSICKNTFALWSQTWNCVAEKKIQLWKHNSSEKIDNTNIIATTNATCELIWFLSGDNDIPNIYKNLIFRHQSVAMHRNSRYENALNPLQDYSCLFDFNTKS